MLSWMFLWVFVVTFITTAGLITLAEWKKPTLSDYYLYFFRNQQSYDSYQGATFRGRVQLLNPSMRDGNFSVLLRNITVADTGLYTCRILSRRAENTTNDTISTDSFKLLVSLTVAPSSHSPQPRGRPGVIASLILLLTVIVVLCGIVWIRANQKHKTPEGETCSNV
uniref:Immunoglobulin V-set domain-containing protein n=1 Tax=Oreochromis niloticus TaxID=8128 RepID=A0A669BA72_ORENI